MNRLRRDSRVHAITLGSGVVTECRGNAERMTGAQLIANPTNAVLWEARWTKNGWVQTTLLADGGEMKKKR